MASHAVESFTADEQAFLSRHVTNTDAPVFALVDLPEVVKGALYARYSRSAKSLRRLLLDEFAQDLDDLGAGGPGAVRAADEEAASRAGRLYERVFSQYGDDSVAQLGGAHLAVEQASNLLTKQLEWGRLAAYLEQSTRYMPYDDKPGGRYRYHRDVDILGSPHAEAFITTMDAVFDTYAALLPRVRAWACERHPRDETTSPTAYRNSVNAKACDVLRGLLPAATVSNVGIFASGQAYEQLLVRLRASSWLRPTPSPASRCASCWRVIPSFDPRGLARPGQPPTPRTRDATTALADELVGGVGAPEPVAEVALVAWSPDARSMHRDALPRRWGGSCAHGSRRCRPAITRRVRPTGERANYAATSALERVWYRFDVWRLRRLQRHRMLTIEWTCRRAPATTPRPRSRRPASPRRGTRPSGPGGCIPDLPRQAQYAVGLAWRLRARCSSTPVRRCRCSSSAPAAGRQEIPADRRAGRAPGGADDAPRGPARWRAGAAGRRTCRRRGLAARSADEARQGGSIGAARGRAGPAAARPTVPASIPTTPMPRPEQLGEQAGRTGRREAGVADRRDAGDRRPHVR